MQPPGSLSRGSLSGWIGTNEKNSGEYEMFHQLAHAVAAGLVCSVAVYLLTYSAIGDRARNYPAGAVAPAFLFAPWWAVLAAGFAGHFAAMIVVSKFRRESVTPAAKYGFWAAMMFYLVGSMVWTDHLLDEARTVIQQSDDTNWKRVAESGKAGAFVEANYRPCIATRTTYIYAFRSTVERSEQGDPTVCGSAVVTRARQTGGDNFSQQVSAVIERLPDELALSPAAQAVLDKITNG